MRQSTAPSFTHRAVSSRRAAWRWPATRRRGRSSSPRSAAWWTRPGWSISATGPGAGEHPDGPEHGQIG
eukprot:6952427-Pyramimonas_sp.AAC.1